jgi:site-specific DNA-cytosine methylase
LVYVPAFVAMTSTQVPVVPRLNPKEPKGGALPGSRGRHLLVREALQLQGFPSTWNVPCSREYAYKAIGNAVHVDLVAEVMRVWLLGDITVPQAALVLSTG